MNPRYENLFHERIQIVEAIRNIQVGQSQALCQVQVPESAINVARKFIKLVPNAMTLNNEKLYLRYDMLYSIDMDGGIYELLARDAGEMSVEQAYQKMTDWLDAIKGLLRYALNLLLAPRRPEFQNIKLYSSFYVYQIAKKLNEADKILQLMGYNPPRSEDAQELKINEEVDLELVVKTAADLVILQCDLELLKGNAKAIASEYPDLNVRIADILKARSIQDQTYTDTYNEAIAIAMSRSGYPVKRVKVAGLVPRGVPEPSSPSRARPSPGIDRRQYMDRRPDSSSHQSHHTESYLPGSHMSRSTNEQMHSGPPHSLSQTPRFLEIQSDSLPRRGSAPLVGEVSLSGIRSDFYSKPHDDQHQRPHHTESHLPGSHMSHSTNEQIHSGPPHSLSQTPRFLEIQSDSLPRRGSAPSLSEVSLSGIRSDFKPHDDQGGTKRSMPSKSASEGCLLDRVGEGVTSPRLTSLPEENTSGGVQFGGVQFDVSSPTVEEPNSMLISYSENMPCPDPNDLPEPVFLDEEALAANIPNYPYRRRNSSDLSCSESRVGIFVNARSTDFGESLPMMPVFSPLENDRDGCLNIIPGNEFARGKAEIVQDRPKLVASDVSAADIPRVIADAAEFDDEPNYQNLYSGVADTGNKNRPATFHTAANIQRSFLEPDQKSAVSDSRHPVVGDNARKLRTVPLTNREDIFNRRSERSLEERGTVDGFVVVTSEHKIEREEWMRNDSTQTERKGRGDAGATQRVTDDRSTVDSSNSESNLDFSRSESNLDYSDSHFNASQTWTCDYCTFLNANKDTTCDVCGIPTKKSSN